MITGRTPKYVQLRFMQETQLHNSIYYTYLHKFLFLQIVTNILILYIILKSITIILHSNMQCQVQLRALHQDTKNIYGNSVVDR